MLTPPLAIGNYSFRATYGGDANYHPSTSACEPFGVDLATSGVTTQVLTDTSPPAAPTGMESDDTTALPRARASRSA
jgi:hypothetical protein